MKKLTAIIPILALLALGACDLSKTDEGDTITNPGTTPTTKVLATASLDRAQSFCGTTFHAGRYRYSVVGHVAGLREGVGVEQIGVVSSCGGSASTFGESFETQIDLTSCEDAAPCGITVQAVLSQGSATPITLYVSPCAAMGCE